MNDQHDNDRAMTAERKPYEPPTITRLGTLAELTEGHNAGHNSDITFVASGVGT